MFFGLSIVTDQIKFKCDNNMCSPHIDLSNRLLCA
jgi:hypothetical protein